MPEKPNTPKRVRVSNSEKEFKAVQQIVLALKPIKAERREQIYLTAKMLLTEKPKTDATT